MPLIHSKRPAAFKKNIETEMEHGKPQKQAVAIAYRLAGEKKAKGGEVKCAHGGRMHCNMGCYSKGGEVGWKDDSMLMGRKPSEVEEMDQDVEPSWADDKWDMGRSPHTYDEHKHEEGDDIEEDKELLADGGEVGDGDGDEEELNHVLAEELMTAMEHKDHKQVMEAIEAIVMNCLSKGGM